MSNPNAFGQWHFHWDRYNASQDTAVKSADEGDGVVVRVHKGHLSTHTNSDAKEWCTVKMSMTEQHRANTTLTFIVYTFHRVAFRQSQKHMHETLPLHVLSKLHQQHLLFMMQPLSPHHHCLSEIDIIKDSHYSITGKHWQNIKVKTQQKKQKFAHCFKLFLK